jgi:hypothetical protein
VPFCHTKSPTLSQIVHTLKASLVMHKLDAPNAFYYKLKMQEKKHLKIPNTLWSNSKCIIPPKAPKCLSPLWLLPMLNLTTFYSATWWYVGYSKSLWHQNIPRFLGK